MSAFVPREHLIRVHSDERNKQENNMQKNDFNLLRLFYSLVWVADFLSFKRLTLKRGLWGIFGVKISTSEFFFGYAIYQCATGHKINMIP